jgi:hypothetical protein
LRLTPLSFISFSNAPALRSARMRISQHFRQFPEISLPLEFPPIAGNQCPAFRFA